VTYRITTAATAKRSEHGQTSLREAVTLFRARKGFDRIIFDPNLRKVTSSVALSIGGPSHRLDGDTLRDGRQGLVHIEADAFTGRAGEMRYANGLLRGDTDRDGSPDFVLRIAGGIGPSDGDFIL
jgi:hypothetical protein